MLCHVCPELLPSWVAKFASPPHRLSASRFALALSVLKTSVFCLSSSVPHLTCRSSLYLPRPYERWLSHFLIKNYPYIASFSEKHRKIRIFGGYKHTFSHHRYENEYLLQNFCMSEHPVQYRYAVQEKMVLIESVKLPTQ